MSRVWDFIVNLLGAVPASERAGLSLDPASTKWEIPGKVDVAAFFRALPIVVPEGAVLFLEGKPDEDVRQYLESHAVEPTIRIERGTAWPKQDVFHVKVDADTMNALGALADCHAAPELADHVHVYANDRVILSWYDFADDPIYLADVIPDAQVYEFCHLLGGAPTPCH
jgi:hypothetical protein